jgi:DNA-directed RNA polymerase subunit RPC12/RpoP
MRYYCHFCGKSVTSELPDDSVIRAILACPECLEARRIIIPEPHEEEDPAFPPNREILEGEPICAICGSGKSTHDNGTRNHSFVKRNACR